MDFSNGLRAELTRPQSQWLQNLNIQKDKFETTAQHTARVNAELQKPLYGAVSGAGTIAISVRVKPEYDADKGRYIFSFPTDLLSSYKWALQLHSSSGSGGGSYIGQNAFGATARVTEETTNSVVLYSKRSAAKDSPFVYFNIPPAEAKKLDGHRLEMLYIGKIEAPYLERDVYRASATMSSRTDRTNYITVIGFAVQEAWFFDYDTGKILSKKIKVTQ